MNDKAVMLGRRVKGSIPGDRPDIVPWAEENVRLPDSVRSKRFKVDVTPWLVEPMRRAVDLQTRIVTFMKPVQSGGSTFGEVIILYWIAFFQGFLQYNWSTKDRAKDRWASRFEDIIYNSPPLIEKLRFAKANDREIDFGNVFFRMQGVFKDSYLDSDSVSLQVNEEVHDWEAGHLAKARGRFTAVWNYKSADISNAGKKGDQMDKAHRAGTMQKWLARCPFCSNPHHAANAVHHYLRTKWDEDRPDFGGLRYDASGCRVGFMEYNYNKLRPTIRLQLPCGGSVHNEDFAARRAMSLGGAYSDPTNPNAELAHRSYTYEGVSVDYIDLMDLIKEKHQALKSRAGGDDAPWIRYTQERECIPYDPEGVPIINVVTVSKGIKKNVVGLVEPKFRTFGLDRQKGEARKNELPHWWLVVRDYKVFFGVLRSLTIWEGKCETDEQVMGILREHGCVPHHGCADSGDDTDYVYAFCMRNGINAVKGGKERWYVHEEIGDVGGGPRRIYSPDRPLHPMVPCESIYEYVEVDDDSNGVLYQPDDREPRFWLYSRSGIAEYHYFLKKHTQYDDPEDVSQDYKEHQDAEIRFVDQMPGDGTERVRWIQKKRRNDLLVCARYCDMMFVASMHGGLLDLKERPIDDVEMEAEL